MRFRVGIIIGIAVAVVAVIALVSFLGAAAKEPVIEVGGEEISTLYSTAGEKTITGNNVFTDGAGARVERTYSNVTDSEIEGYIAKLTEDDGFEVTNQEGGTYRLEKAADDEGKTIRIDIRPADSGGTIISYLVA